MFIVARTFRDANGVFSVGSLVGPAEVRTFKSRLAQKHIVDVNEHNIDVWKEFFKNRCDLDIEELLTSTESMVATDRAEVPPSFIESDIQEPPVQDEEITEEIITDSEALKEDEQEQSTEAQESW